VSDLLTAPLELIRDLVGEISSGASIPYFNPFYNLVVIIWMAAIAAIIVAPFWKKFRGFAALLTWGAIFTTLIMRGSSTKSSEIYALKSLYNISFQIALLIVFIFLTIWIFSRLIHRKKVVPKVRT
jgi:hypothetical protein